MRITVKCFSSCHKNKSSDIQSFQYTWILFYLFRGKIYPGNIPSLVIFVLKMYFLFTKKRTVPLLNEL